MLLNNENNKRTVLSSFSLHPEFPRFVYEYLGQDENPVILENKIEGLYEVDKEGNLKEVEMYDAICSDSDRGSGWELYETIKPIEGLDYDILDTYLSSSDVYRISGPLIYINQEQTYELNGVRGTFEFNDDTEEIEFIKL